MCSNGSGDNCLIEQPTCCLSLSTEITSKSCLAPILNNSSGWFTLEYESSDVWTRTSSSEFTSKKHPKLLYPLTIAFLITSPTLYFSIIFALSSFLFEEIICLLDTQAFPLTLSNLISANF